MCGVTNCPLAFRETLALRQIVNELTDGMAEHALSIQVDAGRLLYDVAAAIGLDPWAVLNPAIMCRLLNEDMTRLWPTLTESEDAELVELANIRDVEDTSFSVPYHDKSVCRPATGVWPWQKRVEF